MTDVTVDGTIFSFPDGWVVAEFDKWPQYTKTTGPLELKGCDVVALDGDHLWIIEMKDYTYDGAHIPADLTAEVGKKATGTMAMLYALERTIADSDAKSFSMQARHSRSISIALHIEVKDGGRGRQQVEPTLVALKPKVRSVQRLLGLQGSLVTSTLAPTDSTPWTARRDPDTRARHTDR